MIYLGSFKRSEWLQMLAVRVTGAPGPRNHAVTERGVVYLGGGYWRAVAVMGPGEDPDRDEVRGYRLVNPDIPQADIDKVEQGVAVLLRCKYEKGRA